jgi:hypothetical protein
MKNSPNVLVDIALLFSFANFLSEPVMNGHIALNLFLFFGLILVFAVFLNLPFISNIIRIFLPLAVCITLFANLYFAGKVGEIIFFAFVMIMWLAFYILFKGISGVVGLFKPS